MERTKCLPVLFMDWYFCHFGNPIKIKIYDSSGLNLVYRLLARTQEQESDPLSHEIVIFLCDQVPGIDTPLETIAESIHLEFNSIGVGAHINSIQMLEDDLAEIEIVCVERVELLELISDKDIITAKIIQAEEYGNFTRSAKDLSDDLLLIVKKLINYKVISNDWYEYLRERRNADVGGFSDALVSLSTTFLRDDEAFSKQELRGLLKDTCVDRRLFVIYEKFRNHLYEYELRDSTLQKLRRESMLRQRLAQIEHELQQETGEDEDDRIEEFAERIKKAEMPQEAREMAEKQLKKLSMIPDHFMEAEVIRTYLDWMCSLPWSVYSEFILDIPRLKQILDEDHYDLEKIKKQIIEHFAVLKIKPDKKPPILCLIGPPGVGKTSLSLSLARATGRELVRISLGGVRDEAEIRGHRRTYVGALPGRIIQGMKKAGTINPIFVLDEIDKMGADSRGDPAAALLEVLDPEQNYAFSDNYLEVPFDLSKVMFVCTGNYEQDIPLTLKDRMTVLRLPGYTRKEKLEIAKKFLIPKQIEENGLSEFKEKIKFSQATLNAIIENYTNEAGVRNLERAIASALRSGLAVPIAQEKELSYKIQKKELINILGPIKYDNDQRARVDQPGIVTALAVTPIQGEILTIGSLKMKGTGKFEATGRMGEVMKESTAVARTCAIKYLERHKLDVDLSSLDVHVQFEGNDIPKDGPSAGAALTLAIISLLTDRPVRDDLTLTGEIAFRNNGTVLPVGGIKDKLLAAERYGFKHVFIPKQNKKDLVDLPDEVKEKINIMLVEKLDEIVDFAFNLK